MLQSPHHLCSPAGPSPAVPCLSWTGEPRTGHSTPDVASPGQSRGEDHLPWPAGHAPPNAPQDPTGLLGHQGTLLAHGQLAVHQNSQVLLHRAAFQQVSPSLCWCMGLFLPRCRTLHLLMNTLNSSEPAEPLFVHDSDWQVILLSLSQPTRFSILFSTSALLRKGNEWAVGVWLVHHHHPPPHTQPPFPPAVL